MDWISFTIGSLTAMFCHAIFSSKESDLDEHEEEHESNTGSTDGRSVTMSCQTCRKLKRHIEIEPYLFECTKCKRLVDLR